MENINTINNEVITNETTNNEGVQHFCMKCGTKFIAANNMVRYCPECAKEREKELREKQKGYAKARTARLGLTNISIYKTDKETLLNLAAGKKTTMAEIIKDMIAKSQTVETEEPKKATAKKAAKKA